MLNDVIKNLNHCYDQEKFKIEEKSDSKVKDNVEHKNNCLNKSTSKMEGKHPTITNRFQQKTKLFAKGIMPQPINIEQ